MVTNAKPRDKVKCLRDGGSVGKGEKYFQGNIYTIRYYWGNNHVDFGLEGFQNVVLRSDFELCTEPIDLLSSFVIF